MRWHSLASGRHVIARRSQRRARHLLAVFAASVSLSPRASQAQAATADASRSSHVEPVVIIRDVGPGSAGRLLRAALAAPHTTVALPDSAARVALRRDTTYVASVIVIGGNASVASTVRGDVIVVGGDLFLHPGAVIEGRAVAIGGGVYNSTLATVRGARLSFRDETFVGAPAAGTVVGSHHSADTIALSYRSLGSGPPSAITFPAYGFRLPAYDRVNGASVPFGPAVSLDSGRIEIDPTATYRSHLGVVDAAARARVGVGRRDALTIVAGRGTRTNDDWNRSDFLNGISALFGGIDARNYYRADLLEGRVSRRWESATIDLTPYVGVATERAWSVGPDSAAASAPYSVFLRRDRRRGMLRPNPAVVAGRISSALVGLEGNWASQGVQTSATTRLELPFEAVGDAHFIQATVDWTVGFPTIGSQRLDVFAHGVVTTGDAAPPQRHAYLGGEDGTIVTRDLLSMGGDQLLFIQGLYSVPLDRVRIKLLGSPIVAVRYAVGGAGVSRLPSLVQNVGVRVTVSLLRVQYMIDPATRDSRTSVALSLFR